jgi:hypothetical protein
MLDARPGRSRPGDTFVRAVGACLLAQATNDFATTVAARQWGADRAVEVLTKAAVSPATITGSGWADTLAATALADFVHSIGPQSAGSAILARCPSYTFSGKAGIKVPSVASAATGTSFVSEGNPIPVRQFSISSSVTLAPRTFATILTFDREIFQHSIPTIESLIRNKLAGDIGSALDGAMFDATSGDATRPAGLLVGISATAPAAAGDWAMVNDVATLDAAVAPVAANSEILFVASPKQARRLQRSAQLKNIEAFASSALADKTVIAIASNCLASATDPAPRFDISSEAALVMRDDPTALATVGTPNVVGAPAQSLWQGDKIGLRVRMEVSWGLTFSTGLAYMSAVNW